MAGNINCKFNEVDYTTYDVCINTCSKYGYNLTANPENCENCNSFAEEY